MAAGPSHVGIGLGVILAHEDETVAVYSDDLDSGVVQPSGVGESALTDSTTGTAGTTLAAGVGCYWLSFPATIIAGTSAADYVTAITLGHKFKILGWNWLTAVAVAGASGSRVFNLEIGTTDVGTVVSTCTVTTAADATVGAIRPATTVTGANTGSATDTFSIEVASGGTSITGGSGSFNILVQNMDVADAVASMARQGNALRTALVNMSQIAGA